MNYSRLSCSIMFVLASLSWSGSAIAQADMFSAIRTMHTELLDKYAIFARAEADRPGNVREYEHYEVKKLAKELDRLVMLEVCRLFAENADFERIRAISEVTFKWDEWPRDLTREKMFAFDNDAERKIRISYRSAPLDEGGDI